MGLIFQNDYQDFAKRHKQILQKYDTDIQLQFVSFERSIARAVYGNTPFACNPIIKIKNCDCIFYNEEIIQKCNLSLLEQDACIFHEIGHLIKHNTIFNNEFSKEKSCDIYAFEMGLGLNLASALLKMLYSLDLTDDIKEIIQKRINTLCQNIVIYRPEWTCGRYDYKSHSAIYYNLIEGIAYSFIDCSADIIGDILSVGRNGEISVNILIEKWNISAKCLISFLTQLQDVGLIASIHQIEQEYIQQYRRNSSQNKKNKRLRNLPVKDKLFIEIAAVEKEYSNRAKCITGVMLELTYKCSEKCIHCYNPGAARNDNEICYRNKREELSLESYKNIIDQLYDEGIIKVCLSGGDPFSNKYIWEIINYLYDKDIAFDIYTNGQAIVNQVDKLANFYPRLVGVSIYSGNSQEHDKITRINGSWKKSINVIEQLSELSVPMNIKCCVMRPNLQHYFEVADIANKLGAFPQFEICVHDSVEGDSCVSKHLRLPSEAYEIILRDKNIGPLYVGKEMPNFGGQKRNMESVPCGAGESTFCITPEGDVIPCCSFHLIFGNLKTTTFREILESSKELKEWRSTYIKDYEQCGKFEFCGYCNLCAGLNFSEHGDYKKAGENNCFIAKTRYQLAKKMEDGFDPLAEHSLAEKLKNFNVENFKTDEIKREYNNVDK